MCRRKILLAAGLVFPLLAACSSTHQAVSSTSSVAGDSASPTYNQVFIAANSCQLKLQPVGTALQQVGADFLATPTDTTATAADIKTLLDRAQALDGFLQYGFLTVVSEQEYPQVVGDVKQFLADDQRFFPAMQKLEADPNDPSAITTGAAEMTRWSNALQQLAKDCANLG